MFVQYGIMGTTNLQSNKILKDSTGNLKLTYHIMRIKASGRLAGTFKVSIVLFL